MLLLLLLMAACGKREEAAPDLLEPYRAMTGCTAEAEIDCEYETEVRTYALRCEYVPEGESTVTVLAPESLAGVSAVFSGKDASLRYDDLVLDAGTLGGEKLSPAAVLPRLLDALRNGYLLEESREKLGEEDCLRLTFETAGEAEKLYFTVWLPEKSGGPVAAEVSSGTVLNFRLKFTSFTFGAIIEPK